MMSYTLTGQGGGWCQKKSHWNKKAREAWDRADSSRNTHSKEWCFKEMSLECLRNVRPVWLPQQGANSDRQTPNRRLSEGTSRGADILGNSCVGATPWKQTCRKPISLFLASQVAEFVSGLERSLAKFKEEKRWGDYLRQGLKLPLSQHLGNSSEAKNVLTVHIYRSDQE